MKKTHPESKAFGTRLKTLRLKAGLSAESIAYALEIAPSTYREWENGRAITGLPYRNLANVLGVSIGFLFEDTSSQVIELDSALQQIETAVKKIRSVF